MSPSRSSSLRILFSARSLCAEHRGQGALRQWYLPVDGLVEQESGDLLGEGAAEQAE